MYTCIRVKYPLFSSDLIKLEFSRLIFEEKKLKYQVSSKSFQCESSCCMRREGQMDGQTHRHDEANSRFLLLLLLLLLLTAIGLSPGGSSPTLVQTKIKITQNNYKT
jgi:hypothetical protein